MCVRIACRSVVWACGILGQFGSLARRAIMPPIDQPRPFTSVSDQVQAIFRVARVVQLGWASVAFDRVVVEAVDGHRFAFQSAPSGRAGLATYARWGWSLNPLRSTSNLGNLGLILRRQSREEHSQPPVPFSRVDCLARATERQAKKHACHGARIRRHSNQL